MQDNTPRTTYWCTLLNGFFHKSYTMPTTLGTYQQVTTSSLHQLGGFPKEATSKVRSALQSKVDLPKSHLKVDLLKSHLQIPLHVAI